MKYLINLFVKVVGIISTSHKLMEKHDGVNKMKVKIVSCSESRLWYNNHIGEVYEVGREVIKPDANWMATPYYAFLRDGKESGFIRKDDVEIVED